MEGKRKDERGEGEEWDMPGQITQAQQDRICPGETTLIMYPHTNPPLLTLYTSECNV